MNDVEAAQRAAVVAEARSWVGTPFRDQGAVGSVATKGVAVDCGILAIEVFSTVGVIERFDPRPYHPRRMLVKGAPEMFLEWVRKFAVETEEIKPGNLILYKEGSCFSHVGIVVDGRNIVHAAYQIKEVMTSPLHQSDLNFFPRDGKPRPRIIFDPWLKAPTP